MKKNTLIILLLTTTLVSSCMPALFIGAGATTVASAKDRSFGSTIDDIKIAAKLKKEFISKGFKKLYTKINVQVVQSRVLLTGEVESDDHIMSAVEIAWSIYGVREVLNELKLSDTSNRLNTAQFTKDTWITSRIKASTFFNRSIKFINYTIVTQNNIVYLFGIARSEEELQKVIDIASKVSGVEKVISHVTIKEELGRKIENLDELKEENFKNLQEDED
jgi:osmotically-inducible protein OsmY